MTAQRVRANAVQVQGAEFTEGESKYKYKRAVQVQGAEFKYSEHM